MKSINYGELVEDTCRKKVYEAMSVMNDILYDAERGKITFAEALQQMKAEVK